MKVKVKFFALYREIVGLREAQAEVPSGSTAMDLWRVFAESHPQLSPNLPHTRFALNGEYVTAEASLKEGDEVVFIPPVSGGDGQDARPPEGEEPLFEVTSDPIDIDSLVERVRQDDDGGVVTFLGVVRNKNRGKPVLYLEYEAYQEMALGEMRKIGREIAERWNLGHLAIVHRVGRLEIGQASVAIVVAAPHRGSAFDACRFAIDRLKETVPVWKKEVYADGEVWLANRN